MSETTKIAYILRDPVLAPKWTKSHLYAGHVREPVMKLKPSSWNVMCLTRGTSLSWHLSRHEYVHVIGTTGWDVIDSKWMNVLLFSNVAPGSLWNPWRSRNRSKTTTKWLHGVNEPADRIFVIVTSAKMWCTKWSHGRAIKSHFIVCQIYTLYRR